MFLLPENNEVEANGSNNSSDNSQRDKIVTKSSNFMTTILSEKSDGFGFTQLSKNENSSGRDNYTYSSTDKTLEFKRKAAHMERLQKDQLKEDLKRLECSPEDLKLCEIEMLRPLYEKMVALKKELKRKSDELMHTLEHREDLRAGLQINKEIIKNLLNESSSDKTEGKKKIIKVKIKETGFKAGNKTIS